MPQFVYATHDGVEGRAYLSKDALRVLKGWTAVGDAEKAASTDNEQPAVPTTETVPETPEPASGKAAAPTKS